MKTVIRARPIIPGSGEAPVVAVDSLSFYGEVDAERGVLADGRSIAGRVLVIGRLRGSTVGAYVVYGLRYYSKAPAAIIVESRADPIVVAGAVLAGIPLFDMAEGALEAAKRASSARFSEDGVIVMG